MSTLQTFYDVQFTNEVKKYTVDLSAFVPTGGSVASGSTSYAQSYNGSASGTCTTAIDGGSALTFTTPALSAAGLYTFTASATLSDSQVRKVVYVVRIDA